MLYVSFSLRTQPYSRFIVIPLTLHVSYTSIYILQHGCWLYIRGHFVLTLYLSHLFLGRPYFQVPSNQSKCHRDCRTEKCERPLVPHDRRRQTDACFVNGGPLVRLYRGWRETIVGSILAVITTCLSLNWAYLE